MRQPAKLFLFFLFLGSTLGSMAQGPELRERHEPGSNQITRFEVRNGKAQGWFRMYDTSLVLLCENYLILPQDTNDIGPFRVVSGVHKLFYPNGVCQYQSCMVNGRPVGPSLSRYHNGLPKCLSYAGQLEIFWLSDSSLLYCKTQNEQNQYKKDTLIAAALLDSKYHKLLRQEAIERIENESELRLSSFNQEPILFYQKQQGVLHGNYTAYKQADKILESGFYCNGLPCGTWNYYHPSGQFLLKQIVYGVSKDTVPLPEMVSEYNYESGKISRRERYKNGKLNGWQCSYQNNGLPSDSFYVKDGISSGKHISLQEDGSFFRVLNYDKNGKQDGLNRYWFMPPYGNNLMEEVNYKHGLREGKARFYYPSGQLKMKGIYTQGKMDKTWFWFDTNGVVLAQLEYKKGLKVNADSLWVCHDKQYNERFMNALETIVNSDSVSFSVWEFQYMAPVWPMIQNCFVDYFDSDHGGNRTEQSYYFKLVAFEPIYFEFPKKGGIQLRLNPCWHYGEQSEIETSVNFTNQIPEQTRLYMDLKKAAFVFPHFLKDAHGNNYSLNITMNELMAEYEHMYLNGLVAKLPDSAYLPGKKVEVVFKSLELTEPQRGMGDYEVIRRGSGTLKIHTSGGVLLSEIQDISLSDKDLFITTLLEQENTKDGNRIDACQLMEPLILPDASTEVYITQDLLENGILLTIHLKLK